MTLKAHTYTHKGGREKNEDCVFCSVNRDSGTFIIADGLGGHSHGEVASQTAVNALVEVLDDSRGLDAQVIVKAI